MSPVRLAGPVLILCVLLSASLPAQPPVADAPGLAARDLLTRADAELAGGQLLEADRLFRAILEMDERLSRRCYEGLLQINPHLGRHQQTIQDALSYRQLLRQRDPAHRLGEVTLLLGETYLALGHLQPAVQYLHEGLDLQSPEPLPPLATLNALASLARIAEKRGDRPEAMKCWGRLERYARAQLDDPPVGARRRAALTPTERVHCVWKLAEAYRFQGKADQAIDCLRALLPLHDRLNDPRGKRDTLHLLAHQYNARRDPAEAEACLQQALELHAKVDGDNRVTHAELWNDLAETYLRLQRRPDAERCRDRAVALYEAASREAPPDQPALTATTRAVWKLEQLYQRREQNLRALNFLDEQTEPWERRRWMGAKLQAEKGSLLLLLGSYDKARRLLGQAVEAMEAEALPNLLDLPRALLALAIVEQAAGKVERAEELGRRGLKLYRTHALPDDVTLAETHNLLGTCLALRGDYTQAIGSFREGVACCTKLGAAADRQHSNLLVDVGLVHKAQGDLDEALRCCLQARDLQAHFAETDSLETAALEAALANLYTANGNYREADELATDILKRCTSRHITGGPLVIAARHSQAMYALYRKQYGSAEERWRTLLELQEKENNLLLVPRTLNGLGHAAELQGHLETADKYYRQALSMQQSNSRAFPATHFISLWRLANVLERQHKLAEAIALLEQGLPLVEAVRLRTYGDAQQRAAFFAQFAAAFEQLVEWCVRAGRVEDALAYAARTRSRTLMDQLQLARVDPRLSLAGPRGQDLRRQEEELSRRIGALRARALLLSLGEDDRKEAEQMGRELTQAQQDYAGVWREILDASPVYRTLIGTDDPAKLVASLREKVTGPRRGLLVYYLGREHSYLLLLGDRTRSPAVFSLTVSPRLLNALAALTQARATGREARDKDDSRGFIVKVRPPATAPVSANAPPEAALPLTQERARYLVDVYRQQLEDPDSQLSRGFRVVVRDPARSATDQAEALGDVFLPPAARQRIKDWGLDSLVVVPDGALHKVPLEALPLEPGAKPRYLIDELPPLVYAPSAVMLAVLADRPPPAGSGRGARAAGPLLTVGNPAYPQKTGTTPAALQSLNPLLGLRGQLPLLPFTGEESRRVRQHFDADRVRSLTGEEATEQAVVAALPGRRIVHLAAHGFADDRFGNLFGALALAPPRSGQEAPDNDGFLSFHEIYRLPLGDCELAVLSACETNAGPQRPLEAGVTLAGGFLAAGARRVVASHWSVDDKSTAELMSVFIAEVADAARRGEAVPYARALQKARLQVRRQPRWSSPFYWAPFVLIGPPENGASK